MLKVKNISFSYSNEVLNNISFTANKGDYIAVVGESGCGKSTLLEIIYGLLHIEKGTVFWNNTKLLGPTFNLIPGEGFMKYLPQDFDLMPYITVEENVGKNLSYLDKNRSKRIAELLEVVDMSNFLKTKVVNLSGGQKQRVAIAKVLAKEPEVLLLDEPFSHIDNFRKNKLRRSLFKYLKSQNILCIVATHDTTDALSFANEIIVLKDAKIEAQGTPETIYNKPKNAYVASFFNEINKVPSKISGVKNKQLFYPNEIKIVENSALKVTVTSSYFKGSYYLIEVEFKGKTLFIESECSIENDEVVFIEFN
ncbi:ABC-type Fe3+/spermidine/putrescine transport systems, ATPase components [Lutibacter oricola]|uniref:ABC-type Fe3+/spermidine/putrescine transport systems, ATPase components n=1 Tax=Lutibacter oricola TaxID=762486 RepID=A0A1H2QT01_9FLAO|nr:ABC transporter ATP-binding protein [Lutibacter oricola]SDW10245.1 ABC-type Fe3+/spermidine/putrescine transport systems, ATPase components [Lutibacter oricola]